MSEFTPPFEPSGSHGLVAPRRRGWGRVALFLCLIAVMAYVGMAGVNVIRDREILRQSEASAVASAGLIAPGEKVLSAKFSDSNGRLLADPPASPDQWVDPVQIVVAHIPGTDEIPGVSWQVWEGRLAKAIGKKVVDQVYTNSADQVTAAASGKVTLLALHAADAPFLVNTYGFEPLAVLGDQSGINGNRLDVIVSSGSAISKLTDLTRPRPGLHCSQLDHRISRRHCGSDARGKSAAQR